MPMLSLAVDARYALASAIDAATFSPPFTPIIFMRAIVDLPRSLLPAALLSVFTPPLFYAPLPRDAIRI